MHWGRISAFDIWVAVGNRGMEANPLHFNTPEFSCAARISSEGRVTRAPFIGWGLAELVPPSSGCGFAALCLLALRSFAGDRRPEGRNATGRAPALGAAFHSLAATRGAGRRPPPEFGVSEPFTTWAASAAPVATERSRVALSPPTSSAIARRRSSAPSPAPPPRRATSAPRPSAPPSRPRPDARDG